MEELGPPVPLIRATYPFQFCAPPPAVYVVESRREPGFGATPPELYMPTFIVDGEPAGKILSVFANTMVRLKESPTVVSDMGVLENRA